MKANFKSFFIQLFVFSIFTLGLLLTYQHFTPQRFQTNLGFALWLFFTLTTTLIHYILIKAAEQNPKKFITYFMLITALKLFGYLIIILIYALLKREQALGFTICFLLLYMLYTTFEVISLLKHFKK